jgi:hypothetical protein
VKSREKARKVDVEACRAGECARSGGGRDGCSQEWTEMGPEGAGAAALEGGGEVTRTRFEVEESGLSGTGD